MLHRFATAIVQVSIGTKSTSVADVAVAPATDTTSDQNARTISVGHLGVMAAPDRTFHNEMERGLSAILAAEGASTNALERGRISLLWTQTAALLTFRCDIILETNGLKITLTTAMA